MAQRFVGQAMPAANPGWMRTRSTLGEWPMEAFAHPDEYLAWWRARRVQRAYSRPPALAKQLVHPLSDPETLR